MAYTKASKLTMTGGYVQDTSGAALNNIKLLGMYASMNPKVYYNSSWEAPAMPPQFTPPPASFFMNGDNTTRITLRDGGSTGDIIYTDTLTNTGGVTDSFQINFGQGISVTGANGVYLDGLSTTLTSNITKTQTTIPVTPNTAAEFPTAGALLIDSELILYYAHTNSSFSVPPAPVFFNPFPIEVTFARGWQKTGSIAHSVGTTVHQVIGYITFFYEQL